MAGRAWGPRDAGRGRAVHRSCCNTEAFLWRELGREPANPHTGARATSSRPVTMPCRERGHGHGDERPYPAPRYAARPAYRSARRGMRGPGPIFARWQRRCETAGCRCPSGANEPQGAVAPGGERCAGHRGRGGATPVACAATWGSLHVDTWAKADLCRHERSTPVPRTPCTERRGRPGLQSGMVQEPAGLPGG